MKISGVTDSIGKEGGGGLKSWTIEILVLFILLPSECRILLCHLMINDIIKCRKGRVFHIREHVRTILASFFVIM